ncbi:MAG: phosphotransferase family protein [Anaerolineae bacterium]
MSTNQELQAALEGALREVTGGEVGIAALAMMPGGASQEMWRLDLTIPAGPWQGAHQLVMRRHVGTKIFADALDPAQEFRVLQAAYESGVPAPRPYWFLGDLLGRPCLVMQRLEGETIGRRIVQAVGLAEARKSLPHQMGAALGAIHRVPAERYGLNALIPSPKTGETPAIVSIRRAETDLDRIGEPHPALELVLRWLRRNEPAPPEHLALVHGDYRIGNVVVTPQGLTGVLDWEFAHLGDPAEDLAWGMVRDWRFGVDKLRYGGVGQPQDFFAGYQECTGIPVDLSRVHYWEVMGNLLWAAGTLDQAERHLRGVEPNLELASLGRRCAEMELEALRLVRTVDK